MSVNTQTTGIWITDPDAYRKKLLDLLGDRDPIEVMSQTADVLSKIVGNHSKEAMQTRPFENKWTPNEIIGHLIDAEWIYGYRMRLIFSEEQPTILGMDQDLWVAAQRYNDRNPKELVEMFRSMRTINLSLWKQMSSDDLKRFGKHNERGEESLGTLLNLLPGHDLWHIDQINRYLDAINNP